MNKKTIIEELKNLDVDLAILVNNIDNSEYMKLEGALNCRYEGGTTRFYKRIGKKQAYLSSEQGPEIRNLCRKQYYTRLMKAAKKERIQISRCLAILESGTGMTDIDDVLSTLSEPVRRIVKPLGITDEGFAARWLKEMKKGRNRSHEINSPMKAPDGTTMKSKSEIIIANRLHSFDIPYVYEERVTFDDGDHFIYPDFIVLNKRTRKQYYWEHFGKISDEDYVNKQQIKLEQYARNNIFPGDGLLVSFESKERSLSTEYVDLMIKKYLL